MLTIRALLTFLMLAVCSAQPDPTTICVPNQIEWDAYDLNTDMTYTIGLDFDKGIVVSAGENFTSIQDMNNMVEYEIDATGSCTSRDLTADQLHHQCLPADSKFLTNFTIGFGPNAVQAQAWDMPYNGDRVTVGISVQPGQPMYPLLIQDHGAEVMSVFYVNPRTNITNPGLFDLPTGPCPLATIV